MLGADGDRHHAEGMHHNRASIPTVRMILLLTLVVMTVMIAAPSEGAPVSKISDVPPAPWLDLPEEPQPTPLVNRMFSEILGRIQEVLAARWGGAWLSFETDHVALNVSAVQPTAVEQSAVEAIVKSYPDFPYALNPIVPVSYSYDDLVRFYEVIDAALAQRGDSRIGVGVRPDLGKIVVEVPSPDSPEIDVLSRLLPNDAVIFTVSPPVFGTALIGRVDIPPYKAGKVLKNVDATVPPGATATCTSGPVFTGDNGSGWDGVLMGSTAGHCYRLNQRVADGGGDVVGRASVSPITFWTGNPAEGDAALLPLSISGADFQQRIIIDDFTQYEVPYWKRNSGIVVGLLVCASGATVGYDCGYVTSAYPTRVPNIVYYDPSTGEQGVKAISHLACSQGLSQGPGDSGAAVFVDIGWDEATAVGLVSNIYSPLGTCFDTVGHINQSTPGHIWNASAVP